MEQAQAPRARLLIIDDHIEMARVLADEFSDAGYHAACAASGAEALVIMGREPIDLVVTDLRMKDMDGVDVLRAVKAIDPGIPVIIMTAFGSVESAVDAIRQGAFHYVTKPFNAEDALVFIERALTDRRLRDENQALRRIVEQGAGKDLLGGSKAMQTLRGLIERVAPSQAPVLIRGETGSGKELVARALHFGSPRRERAFVVVNCTTLPEQLLESELFGHAKGAYTGAATARRGLFVEADGGTLFLDEIGDMAPALQARLLRVLEDGSVRPVGSDVPRRVNVRVVAATHQDLEARIKQGTFRQDLFYRLHVGALRIPPLRERADDIPALAQHFLGIARARNPGSPVRAFSARVLERLQKHHWPGNVRELENVVERLVLVGTASTIEESEFEAHAGLGALDGFPMDAIRDRVVPLRELESDYIAWVLHRCGGNKTRAAELLGIDVSTVHRRDRERSGSRNEP